MSNKADSNSLMWLCIFCHKGHCLLLLDFADEIIPWHDINDFFYTSWMLHVLANTLLIDLKSVKRKVSYLLGHNLTLQAHNAFMSDNNLLSKWHTELNLSWPPDLLRWMRLPRSVTWEVQRYRTTCLKKDDCSVLRCFRVSVRLLESSKPNPLPSSCFHPCRGREGWLRGKVGGEIQTHTGPSRHIFHAKKPCR